MIAFRNLVRQRRDWAFLAVIFTAALVRLPWPGLYQLKWDEVRILDRSLRLARHGEWVWLSNNTSWSVIPGHSPFSNYVLALPYLISTDPRLPRLLVGVMGVIAVGLLYWSTRRYFGRTAAATAGLLFALSPSAVDWSRFVWNPNLAQPFLALWVLTGLLGYVEGKRWAQAVHWLALSLAVQAQVGYILIAPLSLLLVAVGWFRAETDRRALLRYTALGCAIAAISLIPWIIGSIDAGFPAKTSAEDDTFTHTFDYVQTVFSTLASSTEFWVNERAAAGDNNWWPVLAWDRVLRIKTWLTLAGAAWLLAEWVRERDRRVPGAFLALLTVWPLIGFVVSPIFIMDFYLMPVLFGAYPVQGIVLARLAAIRSWARWPVAGVIAVFALLQGWLIVGAAHWLDVDGAQEAFRAPMRLHLDLLDSWAEHGADIVLLTETVEGKYGPTEQAGLWRVTGEGYPSRVVNMPQGIPIHPGGQVIVGTLNGPAIPLLFGAGMTAGELNSGDPIFRWVTIPAGYAPEPDVVPDGPDRFSSGVRVLGVEARGGLVPGQPWPLTLYWQPERSDIDQQYQFSVRLIDGDTTYAQWDIASLNGWLWHAGDIVVNAFDLPVADTLPPGAQEAGNLAIQLIMYAWPDITNADVLDASGQPVGQWLLLPVSGD
ncbi:MAG: glycosyltransferase family 39 protein [Anaerolineae bacterium]|nr:glycosyltransferase family 39 protein [Anaerolineae bacterium]